MRKILFYLLPLFEAPGVMVHEIGHAIFCLFAGVKINKFVPFRFGNPVGYVIHEEPEKFYQSFFISFGPFIVNSLIALVCFARLMPPYWRWQIGVWAWIGVVVALHAIPSTQDALSLLASANRRVWRNPLVLLGYPFVLVLYVLNLLKRIHIDWVYVIVLFWLGRIYWKV